jgi:hypothetical protein
VPGDHRTKATKGGGPLSLVRRSTRCAHASGRDLPKKCKRVVLAGCLSFRAGLRRSARGVLREEPQRRTHVRRGVLRLADAPVSDRASRTAADAFVTRRDFRWRESMTRAGGVSRTPQPPTRRRAHPRPPRRPPRRTPRPNLPQRRPAEPPSLS